MINKDSKISFVIPAYNCADTIIESVDSIFDGNFEKGDEVIIVDDASTDETENTIHKLIKKYPKIIYIKNALNKGCPASRNVGITKATNSLIFNLDSDNVLAENSIKKLKEYLLDKNADMASFSQYYYFQKKKEEVTHKWIYDKEIMTLADFLAGPINPGQGGNFLYTKASWQKIGGYWEYGKGLHEAWGFTLKQLANGAIFAVLPNSHYFHRYGHDSLFITESRKKNEGSIMATKMIMNFIDLINNDDIEYIKNDPHWFDNLSKKPVRLKNGEIGSTGYKINLKNNRTIINIIKKNIFIQKIYYIYKKIIQKKQYQIQYKNFKNKLKRSRGFTIDRKNKKMILNDNTESTNFDTHYIYHPAWATRVVKKINPKLHIDISSTLSFSSILSAFIPVKFYDFRPAHLFLNNMTSEKADLQNLSFKSESIDSLSCMHTIEHIGLGRYGDPIDPDGDLKAISELKRVLAHGGNLLFVVPIGKPQIFFNAHRIYSYEQIMNYFHDLKLEEFSLIPDNAIDVGIIRNATKELADMQKYSCGCFWFKK